eukprot:14316907-Alexandrium_andersonii.AAC.1
MDVTMPTGLKWGKPLSKSLWPTWQPSTLMKWREPLSMRAFTSIISGWAAGRRWSRPGARATRASRP